MATPEFSVRRLILTGGFAVAVAAAPAVAALAVPSAPAPSVAACPNGEIEDTFTTTCTPELVPNSPEFGSTSQGGLPSVDGIPCTGANSGQCIGLSEDAPSYVPPSSSVGSSPTVHGVA
ncbi:MULTISPECIES: intersectin-EH binding protein Ibp1 [unclassified Mycobacterium]|uniref:intersectin-EH binding protein Ibp1 n=1 Tax=unclassified Mycobacterium TaxID=2642494 RepID=UPI0029C978BA|nr:MULTISPECIES: intersectin-EH binding protein Ibp1 [unclassified Mycobacterium]